ncbi:translation initiation factor IF-2 [Candidatus Woesearchaeota archaeon]|nr:translation initiation factor IF-2 [Candidatus Woesearchaeota archaeon]
MATRSPICTVIGHVDHGKSSILDKIRGTAITSSEAGAITQAIGASIIPLEVIKKICGSLLQALKMEFTIPGLLFIDTPGHAAFTNLRKRGGNLADIAVLVIDIREGIKPQTIESIGILKQYKTPFIIAANKIDLLHGWKRNKESLIADIASQNPQAVQEIEAKLYNIVAKMSEYGLNAERFDRVEDYTKQVAIVPTSAQTGEGIAEMLMVIAGLAQKYLEQCLKCDVGGNAKGIIMEVKEEKGIGKSIDVIIHDGSLKVNDTIVIGGLNEPIVTKVRGLFEPAPLAEMRDKKSRFSPVKKVHAAIGVKIVAPDIDAAVAGMPVIKATPENIGQVKENVQQQVEEVIIETSRSGVVVKADSLGSLEALIKLLKKEGIEIRKANIGNITKKDISDAASNYESDPFTSAILGFNVKDISGLCDERVKIINSPVIYDIIDRYKEWLGQEKRKKEAEQLENLVQPCKLEILKGYVFRQSSPAIFGVEVVAGVLRSNTPLMSKSGNALSSVKSIQAEKEAVEKAGKKKQVAISLPNITFGRQVNEGDILYSDMPEEDFRKFKRLKDMLSEDQKMVLKEIAEIKRQQNIVWGV